MHLSKMNRLHRVYTTVTFGQAGIKSYLPPPPHPPGQVQNLGGQVAVKSSLPLGQVLKKSSCQPLKYGNFRIQGQTTQTVLVRLDPQ